MVEQLLAPDPLIGALVDDRYLVASRLGIGGMGLVYEATQIALERAVAVKVLRPELAADRAPAERLLREARAAGSLDGEHVAAVHDVGWLSDGRPYLVMDRLYGPHLGDVIAREAPMAPARVVELLRGPASVLTKAHARGIVHRDVKPENLILARRDGGGERVVLVDFGLAAFCEPGPTLERLTRAGVVLGTPEYMAPETIGEEAPSAACDVYGLATIAFEMLAGFPPFQATNPIDLLRVKCEKDAPPLVAISGIPFPEPFEIVMAHGLARRTSDRFDTPDAFVHALAEAIRVAYERSR